MISKLKKMYDDRVIELGKKTEDLNKKLEIMQLFKEEEEKLQLQFLQEYPVKD